jgi:hypothetical protein
MASVRLLLLEFFFPDRYSQFRSRNFPFLLGQARSLGIQAAWMCCYTLTGRDSSQRYSIELEAAGQRELLEAVGEFAPSHVILSEQLAPAMEQSFARVAAGAEIAQLTGFEARDLVAWPADWLPGWLGLTLDHKPKRWLMDEATPAYDCRALARLPGAPAPPVQVSAGIDCTYRRSLEKNRHFQGIDWPAGVRRFGCSFCVGPVDLRYPFATPAVDLALAQCFAALEAEDCCLARDRWVVNGAQLFARLETFFDSLLERRFPASQFFFGCRIDEFLRAEETLDRLLPRLAAVGHSIQIFNMGVENFSPDENMRLNKGLSGRRIERAGRAAQRLEQDHPDSFGFLRWGGWGLILFTPWTRLADLSKNLEALRTFWGIDAEGFALTSKLQILEESAIRLAAERDGLIAEDVGGFHPYDSGCIYRHDQRELPWRFAHPEVAALYQIACRISPLTDSARGDRLHAKVQAAFTDRKRRGLSALDLMAEALELVRAAGQALEAEQIADRLLDTGATIQAAGLGLVPDNPPGQATPASPAAKRAKEILLKLTSNRNLLNGFLLNKIWDKGTPSRAPELVLALARGDERLVLHLLARQPATPAFLATRRFLLRYNEQTPPDTSEREWVAWVVAANLERYGLDLDQAGPLPALETPRPVSMEEVTQLVTRAAGKEALPS